MMYITTQKITANILVELLCFYIFFDVTDDGDRWPISNKVNSIFPLK
jgi:hypothetical protein